MTPIEFTMEKPEPRDQNEFTSHGQSSLAIPRAHTVLAVGSQETAVRGSHSGPPSRNYSCDLSYSTRYSEPPLFTASQTNVLNERRFSHSLPEIKQFCDIFNTQVVDSDSDSSTVQSVTSSTDFQPSWNRKLDFLFFCISHALGLGNIWRFPYFCYMSGGGSFFVAYLIVMLLCGIPMLRAELAIGQLTQNKMINAFGRLCPLTKGLGIAGMLASFWLTASYSVLFAWSLFYFFNSIFEVPRWSRCNNSWNSELCRTHSSITELTTKLLTVDQALMSGPNKTVSVGNDTEPEGKVGSSSIISSENNNSEMVSSLSGLHRSTEEFFNKKLMEVTNGLDNMGQVRWELFASILVCLILVYIAVRKSPFRLVRRRYKLVLVPLVLLLAFLIRVVVLDGSSSGLHYFFHPTVKGLVNPKVWLYAAVQTLHSFGLGIGTLMSTASQNKQHNDMIRDSRIIALVNLVVITLVGCVFFGAVGHVSYVWQTPIDNVLNYEPGSVFVLYSELLSTMPLPTLWAILFFIMMLCLALNSQEILMETIVYTLEEAYGSKIKLHCRGHEMFLCLLFGLSLAFSMPYITEGGIYYFKLMDHYLAVILVIIIATIELCTLSWLYGVKHLVANIRQMTGKMPSLYFIVCLYCAAPVLMLVIIIYYSIQDGGMPTQSYVYPTWSHILGGLFLGVSLSSLLILAVQAFRNASKANIFSRLNETVRPQLRTSPKQAWNVNPTIILTEVSNKSDIPLSSTGYPSEMSIMQDSSTRNTPAYSANSVPIFPAEVASRLLKDKPTTVTEHETSI
ncbi:sodium-dependent dopamine transporter-like isoform X2 [Tachypleus tridentatus]|uniref:sodium-dependent dopamine transporter-like isoform X2 n=1 Tax=Tachypleus tridentatus TaxID=6853 RepID=UPI003FCFAFD4